MAKSSISPSSHESPSTRKSARITAGVKRTAKAVDSDDAESEQSSPKKKQKTKAITTFEAPPGKKVEPATIRKSTGRFAPINAQIKRAKKIEKRPADITNTETVTTPKPAKRGVKRSAESDALADAPSKPKPTKYAKRTHGAAEVPAAEAANDMVDMNIESDNERDNEAVEANSTSIKGKGKAKRTAPPFKSASDRNGSSIEKPEDATIDKPWQCANRNCNSGQTWHERDSFGRKVISHFFGRNKKQTNLIDKNVWHNYCRKDYQRRTYRAKAHSEKAQSTEEAESVKTKSAMASCKFYIDNINMQLRRIQLWRPQAKFNVQLSKGAHDRMGKYYKELNKNGGDEDGAEWAVTKPAVINAKGKEKPGRLEDIFPIKKMEEFDDEYCGPDFGFDDLEVIMGWVQAQVDNGNIRSMPPMEFLINKPEENEKIIDPTTNYERWTAYCDDLGYITDGEETDDGDAETESAVAGPSGTQNTSSDAEETEVEVEASEVGDATTEQALDDGDIPDYESYVAETPLEDTFPTQDTRVVEDGGYDYDIDSEGNQYDSDSESESGDYEEDEPAAPARNSFGFIINQPPPLANTVGLKATNIPGGVIRWAHELRTDAAHKSANEAISPLTPTAPKKPFENEKEDAVEQDSKPSDANDGVERGVEGGA
jgi:hypothetical protein